MGASISKAQSEGEITWEQKREMDGGKKIKHMGNIDNKIEKKRDSILPFNVFKLKKKRVKENKRWEVKIL